MSLTVMSAKFANPDPAGATGNTSQLFARVPVIPTFPAASTTARTDWIASSTDPAYVVFGSVACALSEGALPSDNAAMAMTGSNTFNAPRTRRLRYAATPISPASSTRPSVPSVGTEAVVTLPALVNVICRESALAVQVEPAVSASLVTRAKNESEVPGAIAAITEGGIARLTVAASGGKVTRVVATAAPPATGNSSIVAPVESYGASAKDALESVSAARQAAKR